MERLWKPEGVNILKGQVGAEWVEGGHVAVENTGEHWRMIRKKFYITVFPPYDRTLRSVWKIFHI